MGFFSSIGSFIGSVGRAIGSGISAVCSGISSVVKSTIGTLSNLASKAVGTFISGIASKAAGFLKVFSGIMSGPLGPILGPIILDLAIKLVVKVVSKMAEEAEVVEKDEKPEEIGYRIEEAEKHEEFKRREDFQNFKEYYSYLKEQIPIEEAENIKINQRRDFYSLLGMEAEIQALEEKFGIRIPRNALVEIGKSAMEVKEVQAFMRAFNNLGYSDLNISEYLKGTLPAGELERITDSVLDALKLYYPEKSENLLLKRLNQMRRVSEDDLQIVEVYSDELREEYGEKLNTARQAGELPKETEKILDVVLK